MIELLFLLLAGHALADFALQPEAMAKGKNRHYTPENVPAGQKLTPCWPYWLASHGLIAGGIVYCITGNIWLGVAETVFHCVIDFGKCENITNPHIDQLLHLVCRIFYVAYLCHLT